MTRAVALGVLAAICSVLSILPQAEARLPLLTPTAEGSWQVDSTHSMVVFRVRHGVGAFWGRFNDVQGTATFDVTEAGQLQDVSIDIQVPIKSVDSGNGDLDRHLRSPDFFNATEHPAMTFRSTSLVSASDSAYTLKGDLTLLGHVKPIEARLKWLGQAASKRGMKAGMEVEFTLKRSDFGMTYGVESGSLGDNVRLIVGLEFMSKSD